MSNISTVAELHKIEETVKEELVKASMHLRGEFQQQLNMERQGRQVMLANMQRDIQEQRSAISTITDKVGAFSHSDQVCEQQETIRKLESQQQAMEKIVQDNELLALKMSAAETTISELQKAVAGYATIHKHVMWEAARQSAVHAEIIQHMEAETQNDQVQELRRECNSQRLQLDAIAAENERLRLKLSVVESSLEDVQRAGGATSPLDLSTQSELHSHVVALQEAVGQLRSDVAVQSSMKTDYLLQQEGLENLRKELSELRLCTTPAAATMNVSLEQSIEKLRADVQTKFTYLEQQAHVGIASTIADTLSQRFADNTHKVERMDKLVEVGQLPNLAGADRNQDMQESKDRDMVFKNFVVGGEWSAAKEATLEEMSMHRSGASSSIHPLRAPEGISRDPETTWIPADLKKSLVTLVAWIQSNLKMQTTAPAPVQSQISEGGGSVDTQPRVVSPHFPPRNAESPRLLKQSLLQTSSSLKSDASVYRRPSRSCPTGTPTSVPSGTSQCTSVENSPASVPPSIASVARSAASRLEMPGLGVGMWADSGPNKDSCMTTRLAARKEPQSPKSMSGSRAFGLGGQHTLRNESGGLLNKARIRSPISDHPSLVGTATSVFRSSSGNMPTSPESVTSSFEGAPAAQTGISSPQQRSGGQIAASLQCLAVQTGKPSPQQRSGGPAIGGSLRCPATQTAISSPQQGPFGPAIGESIRFQVHSQPPKQNPSKLLI